VTGFNAINEGASYIEMEHGIYCHSGLFQAMENGVAKTPARGHTNSDVFTISRVGGQVRYYQNTTLIYISDNLSIGIVFVDSSLYSAGDQIVNASISTTTTGFGPGVAPPVNGGNPGAITSVYGVLLGLNGFSTNLAGGFVNPGVPPDVPGTTDPFNPITGDWVGRSGGTLRSLVGHIEGNFYGSYNEGEVVESPVPGDPDTGPVNPSTGDWSGRAGGTLRMLVGESYGSAGNGTFYAISSGKLSGLVGQSDANMLVPEFTIVGGLLNTLSGFATALGGSSGAVAGILSGLEGFSTNVAGGYVDVVGNGPSPSHPIDAATGDWLGRAGGYLRGLVGLGYSGDAFHSGSFCVGELSGYIFAGRGDVEFDITLGVNAELSGYSFTARGGGYADTTLESEYIFVGSATVITLGQVEAEYSGYEFLASGTTTILGRAYLTHKGKYTLTARGGGGLNAKYSGYDFTAHGLAGGAARATNELSGYSFTASGTVHNFGGVTGILTGLTVGNSGLLVVTVGHYLFLATGHKEAAAGVGIAYEGYSVTLIPAETGGDTTATTHYTNYPFDRIIRFGADYYGVAADGLYRLDGDDYDGVEIVSVVETAQTDFKERTAKRPVSLFLAGRMDTKLKVSVTAAEDEKNAYTYTGTWEGVGNQRVRFGRGIKARYLSYGFTNHTGEDFNVDELAPEIEVLRRNQ
jgi:hypothetical protein